MRHLICAALMLVSWRAHAADPMRVGILHTLSNAPMYLAMERGYFRDEGIDASFVYFDAAQPIAAAAVSGDIDVGLTALTGGFFSLAGRGTLKVIGGALHEQPGFQGTAVLVSNPAFAAGLTRMDQLGGHSFGITQYGASFHYIIGRIAEADGFDLKTVTLRPLQTVQNMLAAVQTSQVDATMAIGSQARDAQASGHAHIIGWAGDVVPYQLTALFAPTATLDKRRDALQRFARAYQHGVADYRAAFFRTAPNGYVHDATTDAAIAQITKYVYVGDPNAADKIIDGVGWYDEGAKLDAQDVARQLQWFIGQGLVRGPIDPATIIDTSFIGERPPG